jgi:hypothetical protein
VLPEEEEEEEKKKDSLTERNHSYRQVLGYSL